MENMQMAQAAQTTPTAPVAPAAPATMEIPSNGSIFSNGEAFTLALRMAQALAGSTIVPKEYQGNISNTLIAVEMSRRLNTSPMMIMQNLYVVNGRPAFSSQYIIAMINSSRKYRTELQFELTGEGDSMACYAWADDYTGRRLKGPTITMAMAKAEGWIERNGSKWKTMPEVMMRYRAAAFFGRLYCADMLMGIYARDEVAEMPEDADGALDRARHQANTIDLSIPQSVQANDAEPAPTPAPASRPAPAPRAKSEEDPF